MDRFDVMQLFVRVVDAGSFSRAAKVTGVAQPTASKQISQLEKRLGAQLLRRTSRGLSLTSAGQDYYESAVRLLSEVDAAEARIGHDQNTTSGHVRVAISAAFGRMYVVPRLPELFARYPGMSVTLEVSERFVNLVESGIDVAIRIGFLSDSLLFAKRIGNVEAVTVATPAYFARHGRPKVPSDLQRHTCVVFTPNSQVRPWEFANGKERETVKPAGLVMTNDAEHIRAAVLAGLGIAHNSSWLFAADIASGAVVRVLKEYAPPPYPINAVWPSGRRVPEKVKAFVEFLALVCDGNPSLKLR